MFRRIMAKAYHNIPGLRELRHLLVSLEQIKSDLSALRTAQSMHINDLQMRQNPRFADPTRLLRYAHQVNSQNGEDGMIREIFRRIGTSDRVFAEVGVGDGTENNTAWLLAQGWKGFWIDGNDSFCRTLADRKISRDRLKWAVSLVRKENIATLFEQLGVAKEFDLLSLDIDQNTYFAWEGLQEYRPRVAVVEYNATLPPDIDWKVAYDGARTWDGTHNFGASLKAFELLGRRLGYSLVGCDLIGTNAFFVRDDLVGDRFAAPFTSENHYEPPRYALLSRSGHRNAILDAS